MSRIRTEWSVERDKNPVPLSACCHWKTPLQHALAILSAPSNDEKQAMRDRVPVEQRAEVGQKLIELLFQRINRKRTWP